MTEWCGKSNANDRLLLKGSWDEGIQAEVRRGGTSEEAREQESSIDSCSREGQEEDTKSQKRVCPSADKWGVV